MHSRTFTTSTRPVIPWPTLLRRHGQRKAAAAAAAPQTPAPVRRSVWQRLLRLLGEQRLVWSSGGMMPTALSQTFRR